LGVEKDYVCVNYHVTAVWQLRPPCSMRAASIAV
jgi:hypothetical protein